MYQSQSPSPSRHPSSPLGIHMFVLCLCLYFCFANKIIYITLNDNLGKMTLGDSYGMAGICFCNFLACTVFLSWKLSDSSALLI